jgi:predicted ArsR family transcriptional regulator
MMRRRDPFGEALAAIRNRVRTGAVPPSAPLVVEDLAADLRLSPTPVREALAHLAGCGVIEGRRAGGRGYAAWPLTGGELAHLYRLHEALAACAWDGGRDLAGPGAGTGGAVGDDLAARAEGFFARLARRGGGPLLRQMQDALADRLHLARLAEPRVLDDVAAELAALEAHDPAEQGLARALRDYHRRRLARAEIIARAAALGSAAAGAG